MGDSNPTALSLIQDTTLVRGITKADALHKALTRTLQFVRPAHTFMSSIISAYGN